MITITNNGKVSMHGTGIELLAEWMTITNNLHQTLVADRPDMIPMINELIVDGLFKAVGVSCEMIKDKSQKQNDEDTAEDEDPQYD